MQQGKEWLDFAHTYTTDNANSDSTTGNTTGSGVGEEGGSVPTTVTTSTTATATVTTPTAAMTSNREIDRVKYHQLMQRLNVLEHALQRVDMTILLMEKF